MGSHPAANSAPVSTDNDPVTVSSTGADITYLVSRAFGYATLLAFSVFVASRLF